MHPPDQPDVELWYLTTLAAYLQALPEDPLQSLVILTREAGQRPTLAAHLEAEREALLGVLTYRYEYRSEAPRPAQEPFLLTDLSVLVALAISEEAPHGLPLSPTRGEGAAFARLVKRGLARRLPSSYGTGRWYTISADGAALVHKILGCCDG